jgi:hypothetical protein
MALFTAGLRCQRTLPRLNLKPAQSVNFKPAILFSLTKIPAALLPAITELFSQHQLVDLAVPAILEGQAGPGITIKVDDLANPSAVQLQQGSFTVFAGSPDKQVATAFIEQLKTPCGIQPSPANWWQWIREAYPERTVIIQRFSFSHHELNREGLQALIDNHPLQHTLRKIDLPAAQLLCHDEWGKYHFMNYHSPEHFMEKSTGYCSMEDGRVAAACTAALVCSKGVELNIITHPDFRKKGLATLVAASLIVDVLEQGLIPHWDAATELSKNLALKLGYTLLGNYDMLVVK